MLMSLHLWKKMVQLLSLCSPFVEFCTGISGSDTMKIFLKDCKIQSRCSSVIELKIRICLYEEKIWEKKNRVIERERERERRKKWFSCLNKINWDYNHIYNAICLKDRVTELIQSNWINSVNLGMITNSLTDKSFPPIQLSSALH